MRRIAIAAVALALAVSACGSPGSGSSGGASNSGSSAYQAGYRFGSNTGSLFSVETAIMAQYGSCDEVALVSPAEIKAATPQGESPVPASEMPPQPTGSDANNQWDLGCTAAVQAINNGQG